jgi:hypothetical protein
MSPLKMLLDALKNMNPGEYYYPSQDLIRMAEEELKELIKLKELNQNR